MMGMWLSKVRRRTRGGRGGPPVCMTKVIPVLVLGPCLPLCVMCAPRSARRACREWRSLAGNSRERNPLGRGRGIWGLAGKFSLLVWRSDLMKSRPLPYPGRSCGRCAPPACPSGRAELVRPFGREGIREAEAEASRETAKQGAGFPEESDLQSCITK